jgi:hypothetical protein
MLAAGAAAALVLLVIAHPCYRWLAARRLRRRRIALREQWIRQLQVARPPAPCAPAFAGAVAEPPLPYRKPAAPVRAAQPTLAPADHREHDGKAHDVEDSLRALLQGWQRVAA